MSFLFPHAALSSLFSLIFASQAPQAFKRIYLKGIYQTLPLFLSRSEKDSTERSLNSPLVDSIRKESRTRHMKRDRGIQVKKRKTIPKRDRR